MFSVCVSVCVCVKNQERYHRNAPPVLSLGQLITYNPGLLPFERVVKKTRTLFLFFFLKNDFDHHSHSDSVARAMTELWARKDTPESNPHLPRASTQPSPGLGTWGSAAPASGATRSQTGEAHGCVPSQRVVVTHGAMPPRLF